VVHNRDRQQLLELYSRHDIAVMPYGTLNSDWAMPIKFPEAIGMGLPILAGDGTAVGGMVEDQGIGWCVGSTNNAFYDVLSKVTREELERVQAAVTEVQPRYTWTERAREIVAIAAIIARERRDRNDSAGPKVA
jgi:glycosyltransferase involved in cell wall biosynthesis